MKLTLCEDSEARSILRSSTFTGSLPVDIYNNDYDGDSDDDDRDDDNDYDHDDNNDDRNDNDDNSDDGNNIDLTSHLCDVRMEKSFICST